MLILAAWLVMYLLLATHTITLAEFTGNPEIENISHPKLKEILVPACGAIAGMVMIAAYRRSVIAEPLIAVVIIPAAAMIGASIAASQD